MRLILASITLFILGNFIECSEDKVAVLFQYKSNLTLDCSKLGKDVDFYRVPASAEVPVVVSTTAAPAPAADGAAAPPPEASGPVPLSSNKEKILIENNVLTIIDLRGEDFANYTFYCAAKSNPKEKIEFVKKIGPFLYKPDKTSHTITEGGSVELSCVLLYGSDKSVSWNWTKSDMNTTLHPSDKVIIDSTNNSSKLTLKKVGMADKGTYHCHVSSEHGSHSEAISLRVKDTLAALWPFLAIVAEVVILCVIILVYEKKCAKKNSSSDEDNEQAQNLMGKDGQVSDVKKRTAKA